MLGKIKMINFDDYANENKTNPNLKWWLRIWKSKCIIKFNKQQARYW